MVQYNGEGGHGASMAIAWFVSLREAANCLSQLAAKRRCAKRRHSVRSAGSVILGRMVPLQFSCHVFPLGLLQTACRNHGMVFVARSLQCDSVAQHLHDMAEPGARLTSPVRLLILGVRGNRVAITQPRGSKCSPRLSSWRSTRTRRS